MVNALTSALFIVALVGLVRWAGPRQPQWSSPDASRFISMACEPDPDRGHRARWTRVHGRIDGDAVTLRQGFLSAARLSGTFPVHSRAEAEDPRYEIFTLGGTRTVHLKVPAGGPLADALARRLP